MIPLTDLRKAVSELRSMLRHCRLCPRNCGVNRVQGELGFCKAGLSPAIYSYAPHHGEEPPLSAVRGSGTIFFTHCNMRCYYCQNYKFSQLSDKNELTIEELADIMMHLNSQGVHNINLVSPTHYVPQIAEALLIAKRKGLSIPVVYNTGGYDSPEVIRLLKGIVDIYMPDIRYSDETMAVKYSSAPGYIKYNQASILKMQEQVGDLALDKLGVATRGLIIRCLVLPNNISGTEKTIEFIASNVSRTSYISLMSQYYPIYKASDFKELSRRITDAEYREVIGKLEKFGLTNGWIQASPSGMNASLGGHRIRKIKDLR